jgi:hypothetical protein
MEDLVLAVRHELRAQSDLGEFGARAIHRALWERERSDVPSIRTIGRILERRGALDGQRRVRRAPPASGWYLPRVVAREAELDLFDGVEDLVFEGGFHVDVFTAMSLHGGLPGAWPRHPTLNTAFTTECLVDHWRSLGLPGYAQFDNDAKFTGASRYPNVLGRVVRLCLSLKVLPVFTPARETGFMAAIESFNARWQAKVWQRFYHPAFADLCAQSDRYVAACRRQRVVRQESAPPRRSFPARWSEDKQESPAGQIIYLRRTDEQGGVRILGQPFLVDRSWPHRLVRCELTLPEGRLQFYALRRRQPDQQPLLREAIHSFRLRPTPR